MQHRMNTSAPSPITRFQRAVIATLLIISGASFAQTPNTAITANDDGTIQQADDDRRWYQVEVIIFKNLSPSVANEELWPNTLEFTAPLDGVLLTDPSISRQKNQQDDTLAMGLTDTALLQEPSNNVQNSQGNGEQSAANIAPPTANGSLTPTSTANLDTLQTPDEQSLLPPTFTYIDSDKRQLNDASNAIERHAQFDVIFHEAWLQAFKEGEVAPTLIIRSGETFDQHTPLEGTIEIRLSRYLHVHTDIWSSEFSKKVDYSHSKPFDSQSYILDADQNTEQSFVSSPLNFKYQQLLSSNYSVVNTANLQDHIRMRSDELHYIDSPRMGMLIKINRYDPIAHTQLATPK